MDNLILDTMHCLINGEKEWMHPRDGELGYMRLASPSGPKRLLHLFFMSGGTGDKALLQDYCLIQAAARCNATQDMIACIPARLAAFYREAGRCVQSKASLQALLEKTALGETLPDTEAGVMQDMLHFALTIGRLADRMPGSVVLQASVCQPQTLEVKAHLPHAADPVAATFDCQVLPGCDTCGDGVLIAWRMDAWLSLLSLYFGFGRTGALMPAMQPGGGLGGGSRPCGRKAWPGSGD